MVIDHTEEYTNKLFCDATAITSSFGCQAT